MGWRFWRKPKGEGRIYDILWKPIKLDQKGRLTLPKSFRQKMKLKKGDYVDVGYFPLMDEIHLKKKAALKEKRVA